MLRLFFFRPKWWPHPRCAAAAAAAFFFAKSRQDLGALYFGVLVVLPPVAALGHATGYKFYR